MRRTLVLNVVGLTPRLVGAHTPNIARFMEAGAVRPLGTVTPAVTCTVQASMLTGLSPRDHGVVANGWLFRDLREVWFWRQSNRLVGGEKVWEAGKRRDPAFTCANLFWWYNMAASHDIGVTPRPIYKADGRKLPDCYSQPPEVRDELTDALGKFPLFRFWGPATSIESSRWIARAALHVGRTRRPTLTLVYLPHLDYVLQRLGPDHPDVAKDLAEVDEVVGELLLDARRDDARVVLLSEYGVTAVRTPVHVNRALRQAGWLEVRVEEGRELLDTFHSQAFAVADHQVAHVYVDRPELVPAVKQLLEGLEGVERVLGEEGMRAMGLDHPRSGELVAIARSDAWFTYYYWLVDERAPDFARTVEIHRKPGFDPVELFLDPAIRSKRLALGWRLAKRAAGLRTLMDVIPLDAGLVRGSHGRPTDEPGDGPLIACNEPDLLPAGPIAATAIKGLILDHVFGRRDITATAAAA